MKSSKKFPKIGAHVSVSGGIEKGVKRGKDMGAECLQIFVGSPRRYEVPIISKEMAEKFLFEKKEGEVLPVFIHASYLLNLASEDEVIREKSIKSLAESLRASATIEAEGVVYHPGSPKGGDKQKAIEREILGVKKVLKETPKNSTLIIENTAGIKKIGTDFNEIEYFFKKINSSRLKACIDTAHALEAGIIRSFHKKDIKEWVKDWEKKIGIKNIALLHINDSLTPPGSLSDRHANIGEGFIGEKGFKNLMKEERVRSIPWVLEVPGFDRKGPDKKNIEILKKIRKSLY